ncbi:unnamed protein product [Musa banksii]
MVLNRRRSAVRSHRLHQLLGFVLSGHFLERLPLWFWNQEGEDEAQKIAGRQHEERVPHADAGRVALVPLRRVPALRRVQEPERAHHGPGLARGCRDAVTRGPQPRGEDLRRHDEGGAVGPEVGEEEGEGVHDDEADVVALGGPVVIGDGQAEHEDGHEEESHDLDGEPADDVDEGHGEPVARNGAAERDERLRPGDPEHLLDGIHGRRLGNPVDGAEDVLLEQVLAVEGDVEEEPGGGGADEVEAVAAGKLSGEEAEAVGLLPGGFVLLHHDLHLEDLRHVGGRLLRVLGHQGGVPRGLGHLHPPVIRQGRREGAKHEDYTPNVVGLRHGGAGTVDGIGRRVEAALEGGRNDDRDDAAGEDPEALHGEDGGDEGAASLLVGVLRHDGGGEGVVATDAESEPEAEEAEGGHDALGGVAKGEPGGDGADNHHRKGHAVDFLPAELIPEPPEEELAGEGAAEGDAVHGRGHVGRERAGGGRAGVKVVYAAEELGDEGDAEEVVGVGEEAHAGDDDGREMVPLRLGDVESVEHLELLPGHCCRAFPTPPSQPNTFEDGRPSTPCRHRSFTP